MRAAFEIARKDLRQRARDRSVYMIAIVAPLGLALILGNVFGDLLADEDDEIDPIEYAFVDEDGGPVAAAFGDTLAEFQRQGFVSLRVTDRAGAMALIEEEDYPATFVVPAGFSDAVFAGERAEIVVVGNAAGGIAVDVAQALASGFADTTTRIQLSVGSALVALGEEQEPDPQFIDELAARAAALPPPIESEPIDSDFTGLDFKSYIAAGMTVFFSFFAVQFGVLSLMEEREAGTLTRLLMAPIRRTTVLIGKALGSFAVGMSSVAVMVVATTLLLDASWGDPVGVAVLAVAGAIAGVGSATLVSSLATDAGAARSYSDLVSVILGLLGGSFFAVGQGTGLAASLSWLSPHRWLLDGFQDLNAGDSAIDILPLAAGPAVFGVVAGAVGLWRSNQLLEST